MKLCSRSYRSISTGIISHSLKSWDGEVMWSTNLQYRVIAESSASRKGTDGTNHQKITRQSKLSESTEEPPQSSRAHPKTFSAFVSISRNSILPKTKQIEAFNTNRPWCNATGLIHHSTEESAVSSRPTFESGPR